MFFIFLALASVVEAKTLECRFVSWNDRVLPQARVYVEPEFGFATLAQGSEVVPLINYDSVFSLPGSGLSFDRREDCLEFQSTRHGLRENDYRCTSLRGNISARIRLSFDREHLRGNFTSTSEDRDGWFERHVLRFSRCW
jgi:hypothetical protein